MRKINLFRKKKRQHRDVWTVETLNDKGEWETIPWTHTIFGVKRFDDTKLGRGMADAAFVEARHVGINPLRLIGPKGIRNYIDRRGRTAEHAHASATS